MLRRLSLALAVAAATTGMAWAEEAPLASKTDLVTVYNEAVKNNADLAAARANYAAIKEVVPQARAGLLPNLSAGADSMNTDTKVDTRNGDIDRSRSGLSYRANLSPPLVRADRWFQLQAAQASSERTGMGGGMPSFAVSVIMDELTPEARRRLAVGMSAQLSILVHERAEAVVLRGRLIDAYTGKER